MKIIIPPDVLVSHVGEESVILNLETEHYYGLDDIGARMWSALTTLPTIQSAYDALLLEYEVDAELLRKDLLGLIENLVAHGLIYIEQE